MKFRVGDCVKANGLTHEDYKGKIGIIVSVDETGNKGYPYRVQLGGIPYTVFASDKHLENAEEFKLDCILGLI